MCRWPCGIHNKRKHQGASEENHNCRKQPLPRRSFMEGRKMCKESIEEKAKSTCSASALGGNKSTWIKDWFISTSGEGKQAPSSSSSKKIIMSIISKKCIILLAFWLVHKALGWLALWTETLILLKLSGKFSFETDIDSTIKYLQEWGFQRYLLTHLFLLIHWSTAEDSQGLRLAENHSFEQFPPFILVRIYPDAFNAVILGFAAHSWCHWKEQSGWNSLCILPSPATVIYLRGRLDSK